MIYLDHAATTPVREEVREEMAGPLQEVFGNPSSTHAAGRAARALVDLARDRVAEALNCRPREVVFTGGGSEADNLALRGPLSRLRGEPGHLIISQVEHEAVLETARDLRRDGWELTELEVDSTGLVDPGRLAEALRPDTRLVSVMLANNEVGTVEPVGELARVVRERSEALFHTDATQALGKLPVDVQELGVDLLTISAHKVGGPKGAGALFVRHGVALDPVITGGGQERNRRSGTENVPGIVGLGLAARLAERERESEAARQRELTSHLEDLLLELLPAARPTGARGEGRLPNFCTLAIPGAEGELLLMRLDRAGVCASAGSACASGSQAPSHVLLAMGLPPSLAGAHLRLTLGRGTTRAEVEEAAEIVGREVAQLRQAVPI